MKVGHVSTVGMNYFPCVVSWNKLWKLIMQLVKSKNCPALCLDSSGLILVVSAHPQGATGKGRISFHYKYCTCVSFQEWWASRDLRGVALSLQGRSF